MSPTQASPGYVDMCFTGGERTLDYSKRNIAYEILARQGWKAGEKLGINGAGLVRPLDETMYDDSGYQSLTSGVTVLLESQFDSGVVCEEGGSMCEFCTKRDRVVYTVFHELDDVDETSDDYSLPRLPEVCVFVWQKYECID